MRYAPSLLVVVLLATPPRSVAAQCDGKIVSAISITPHAPSFIQVPRPLRTIARGVGLVHTTTKAVVVRRFLLVHVGRPCSTVEMAESERILRLQPFIAEATVRAVPDSVGGVRIEVETVDAIPTVFSLPLRNWLPAALLFGNGNAGGRGVYVAARLGKGFRYRTGLGVQVVDYQAFGRPYTLAVEAHRAPLGSTLRFAFGHAFLTDLQRTGWHLGYSNVDGYTYFVRPDSGGVSLGVVRRFADIGRVQRVGVGRRIGFLGGLLVFALFLVVFLHGISIVWGAREDYAMLTGTGILSMFFFHALVNVGMAMGIMPVTGIPLMFVSLGGSALWTGLVGIGILMNISRRRLRY